MEKQRKQLIGLLIVLAVAVIALFAVSRMSDDDTQETEETYAVNEMEADSVTRLVFTNTNGTVSLSKSGEDWVCEDDKTIDIDEDEVDKLVAKVAGAISSNIIENVTDISQYGLDDPVLTIMISDGTNSSTILVGSYNSISSVYYICLESDTSTVYTTSSSIVVSFNDLTVEDLIAEPETETETETLTEVESETKTETETETLMEAESETEVSTVQ
jgi:hypothetical protein